MKFTLYGEPTGCGKNNVKVTRFGKRVAPMRFIRWQNACLFQMRDQVRRRMPWTVPMFLSVQYWPKTNRRIDATAILDGVFHVLETAKLIEDDRQISILYYKKQDVDSVQPRLEIQLEPAKY